MDALINSYLSSLIFDLIFSLTHKISFSAGLRKGQYGQIVIILTFKSLRSSRISLLVWIVALSSMIHHFALSSLSQVLCKSEKHLRISRSLSPFYSIESCSRECNHEAHSKILVRRPKVRSLTPWSPVVGSILLRTQWKFVQVDHFVPSLLKRDLYVNRLVDFSNISRCRSPWMQFSSSFICIS